MMSKKNLYRWHKRFGLTFGFILFLLGMSGAVITYRDELLPRVYPELFSVKQEAVRLPVSELIASTQSALPETAFTHFYTSERADTASMFFMRPEGALLPHLITVNPYNGVIKGEMPLLHNVFGVLLYVHANLLLGKTGGYLVGLMGIVLLLFFITGVMIFWSKEWKSKMTNLRKQGVRGLHRGVGIILGIPLIFSAISGFILAFDLTQPVGRLMGEKRKPEDLVRTGSCDLNKQIHSLGLLSLHEQSNIVSIHFCTKKNALMKVSAGLDERSGHHGYQKWVIDSDIKRVLQKFDTRTDPQGWSMNALTIYPMHTGSYFGEFGRILTLLTGLALSTLYLTGLTLSLRTYFKNKKRTANYGLEIKTPRIDLV